MPDSVLHFLVRLRQIDRRIINTLVVLMLALPIVFHVPLTILPLRATHQLKETIDALPPDALIVIAVDWEAGTKGECEPLTAAVMDYCFKTNRRFAIFGFIPQGPELAQRLAERLAAKHGNKTYGQDWINWGYRPQIVATLIAMMRDLPGVLKTDIRGVPLTDYAMMQGIRSLKDVGLVYEVTGTSLLDAYLQFCGGVTLAQGCTAVIGPEQYAYLQSGQIKGLLVGLGGAAQFETVTEFRDEHGNLGGQGMRGMGSQSLGHFLVMALIIVGNLGVWAANRLGVAPSTLRDLPMAVDDDAEPAVAEDQDGEVSC